MRRLLQAFLLLLATATDRELARMVEYLKAENRILRTRLPKTLTATRRERQILLKYGRKLGSKIKDLITIVSPRTFARWVSGAKKAAKGKLATKPGRPRTAEEVRDLVLRLARENSWGYTRILGELKKLGVRKICRSTVIKILKENGFDPGPRRGQGSWDEFLRIHAKTLWATDFFSTKVWTTRGLVDVFVLFVRHDNCEGIADPVSRHSERRCLSRPTYPASKDGGEHSLLVKRWWARKCPNPRTARLAKYGEGYTA